MAKIEMVCKIAFLDCTEGGFRMNERFWVNSEARANSFELSGKAIRADKENKEKPQHENKMLDGFDNKDEKPKVRRGRPRKSGDE